MSDDLEFLAPILQTREKVETRIFDFSQFKTEIRVDEEMNKREINRREVENDMSTKVDDDTYNGPPSKKLKQSRLPFSQIVQLPQVTSNDLKRKVASKDKLKQFKLETDHHEKAVVEETEEVSSSTEVDVKNKSITDDEEVDLSEDNPQGEVSTSSSSECNVLCESLNEGEKSESSCSESVLDKTASDDKSANTSLCEAKDGAVRKKKSNSVGKEERRVSQEKRAREREAKKLEKERLREEMRAKRELDKSQKAKKKLELQQQRDEKKQKKEEEKLKREEEKQKKEEERQKKEEQKQKKLEQLEAKLEEKRQKKLEKSFREEEEQRKATRKAEKEKAAFVGFFLKKDVAQQEQSSRESTLFKAFEVKINMKLAPISRFDLSKRMERIKLLDKFILEQFASNLYIEEIRSKNHLPGKSGQTWPLSEIPDIQVVENVTKKTKSVRAKLIKFHENVRPPYWGTWRKKSLKISPRNPFKKDSTFFDYEVDSDDEWEEEEPGESLSGTEDEKESDDDYEVDNEFTVPHGYLSEDEDEDKENMTLDSQLSKIKIKEMEFERERKEKFEDIKPKLFGPIWINDNRPGSEELLEYLRPFQAVILNPKLPIDVLTPNTPDINQDLGGTPTASTSTPKNKSKSVPEKAMPHIIRLLHFNPKSRSVLVNEFFEYWKQLEQKEQQESSDPDKTPKTCKTNSVSKRQLKMTFQQISSREKLCDKNTNKTTNVLMVKQEYLEKYSLTNVTSLYPWDYVTDVEEEVPENESLVTVDPVVVPSTPKSNLKPIDRFFRKVNSTPNSEDKNATNVNDQKTDGENETRVQSEDNVEIIEIDESDDSKSEKMECG